MSRKRILVSVTQTLIFKVLHV